MLVTKLSTNFIKAVSLYKSDKDEILAGEYSEDCA